MKRREWLGVSAAIGVPALLIGSLFVGRNTSLPNDDHVFATIRGIDCARPDLAPPMNILPIYSSNSDIEKALREAWEVTQKFETNTELARIACGRVEEMLFPLDAEDRVDVRLGLREGSSEHRFARAITSILVERPEWGDEPTEIEGGFIILGELRTDD